MCVSLLGEMYRPTSGARRLPWEIPRADAFDVTSVSTALCSFHFRYQNEGSHFIQLQYMSLIFKGTCVSFLFLYVFKTRTGIYILFFLWMGKNVLCPWQLCV
jgi:hypothetical protein